MIVPDTPVYHCPRIAPALVANGFPTQEAWRSAPVVFLTDARAISRTATPTVARCCWTENHLYVQIACKDDDMWGTYTARDEPLYDEEVVEVFLSPSGDVRRYFEIEVSPRNVVFDAALHSPDLDRRTMTTDRSWDCAGLATRVLVDGKVHSTAPAARPERGPSGRWTAEIAVPFRALGLAGPPTRATEWRMNLYRIDRAARSEYLSWSPTLARPADFHVPTRFGTLRFEAEPGRAVLGGLWSAERAAAWRERVGMLLGCNFIPSTASNQLEMWQAETFDPVTIERELMWAADLGMNAVRAYLHDVAWEADPAGFVARVRRFVGLASRAGIGAILVLFDDCWNPDPVAGPQPAPVPGVHNSRWLQSPGQRAADDPLQWPRLREYVRDVVGALRHDRRVLLWDLYNEPGNSGRGNASLPLLQCAFEWARSVEPSQPLSAGIWMDAPELNAFQLANSDAITFHNYQDLASLGGQIETLKALGRPIVCTEWMARPTSTIATHLQAFRDAGVGALGWGLVAGKTQTIYPWNSPGGGPEPRPWFHDLLRPDGTPYDSAEAAALRSFAAATRTRRSAR